MKNNQNRSQNQAVSALGWRSTLRKVTAQPRREPLHSTLAKMETGTGAGNREVKRAKSVSGGQQAAGPVQERQMDGQNVVIMLEGNSSSLARGWQERVLEQFEFNVRQPPATYPYHRYLEIVEYLRAKVYPTLNPEEAYERLGQAASLAYFNGVSGQILKIAARVMGPVRGARNFVQIMRVALPWDTHELVEVRNGYVCYSKTFSGGSPALMLGFIRASLETAGGKLTRLSYRFDPPLPPSMPLPLVVDSAGSGSVWNAIL